MTKEQLSALIQEAGLGGAEDRLLAAALPSLRLSLHPKEEDTIPLGATKFGGSPDLPPDFEWPVWRGRPESEKWMWPEDEWSREDGPLCFLAQFSLADLAGYDLGGALPPSGILYVFCAIWRDALGRNLGDRDCVRVFYHTRDPAALVRRVPPLLSDEIYRDAMAPWENRITCCSIEYHPQVTLPHDNDREAYQSLGLSEAESAMYFALYRRLNWPYAVAQPRGEETIHRLLGYPDRMQYAKCVPNDEAEEWGLLLQLGTEDDLGIHWQLGGTGYFWIPTRALKDRDFDAVWIEMQAN